MGAATVANLHSNADFLADLEAAKAEVKAAKLAQLPSVSECAAEAAALSAQ